jgi:nicotinate-nucleotide--dimethylbenzimidazole phosphoribosyltransferase
VVDEGVSAYPQEVTVQMVRNMLEGGAAVCVLAAHAGVEVQIVDAGVCEDFGDARPRSVKVRAGSANIVCGPAMSVDDAEAVIASGVVFAQELCDRGVDAIGLGDMGIGNTTPAAAITSVVTGVPPSVTVGRGTGIDDETYARKLSAVERAIEVNVPDSSDGIDALSKVGGFEIGFLAGVAIGAASRERPVVLDGYPTTSSALIAVTIAPDSRDYMLASHASAEPGHRFALEHLSLLPLLDFGMRLGEGTGAALALSMLRAALRLPREMATFEAAGVSRSSKESAPEA